MNKLKQYDKTIFVVGGKAFTSTILQKNCHEFISYESMLEDSRPSRPQHQQRHEQKPVEGGAPATGAPGTGGIPHPGGVTLRSPQDRPPQNRRPVLDLQQAMPLVERALQVLERREVRPQLGLLKSTMLQLDSSFSERAYGAGSFTDFIERLRKNDMIHVTGGEGRYMIQRKLRNGAPEKTVRPEEALPFLRDVLENHRMEVEEGVGYRVELGMGWVKEESPAFDWKSYGFQEFSEFLNYAQDKTVVRIVPDETIGLTVFLGAEFHPPAMPEPEPLPLPDETEEIEEPQPVVPGQPTAGSPSDQEGSQESRFGGPDVNGQRGRARPGVREKPRLRPESERSQPPKDNSDSHLNHLPATPCITKPENSQPATIPG